MPKGRNSLQAADFFPFFLQKGGAPVWNPFPWTPARLLDQRGGGDPEDLCLHGHAVARIAGETVEFDCAVSAAALLSAQVPDRGPPPGQAGAGAVLPLLRLLLHRGRDWGERGDRRCDNGADWTVLHEGENVRLILPDGNTPICSRSMPLSMRHSERPGGETGPCTLPGAGHVPG